MFSFAKRQIQCNIAHRLGTKIFTRNANRFAKSQQVPISERFDKNQFGQCHF